MQKALENMKEAITKRAACFKNTVIIVSVIPIVSVIWAAIQRSWLPLTPVLFLIPVSSAFLYGDIRLVNLWQDQLLEMWIQGELEIDQFSEIILSIRMIPGNTARGMLGTLPAGKVSKEIRKPLAMTVQTISKCHKERMAFYTITLLLCTIFIGFAIILKLWILLAGCLIVLPMMGIQKLLMNYRLNQWKLKVTDAHKQEGWDLKNFNDIAYKLDWGIVSEQKKEQLFAGKIAKSRRLG